MCSLEYERFLRAVEAGDEESVQIEYLDRARQFYLQTADLLPDDAMTDRALVYAQLGALHDSAGDVPPATAAYQRSIMVWESVSDPFRAGLVRRNVALLLARAGRITDGPIYARAALVNLQRVGPGAVRETEQVGNLITELEAAAGSPASVLSPTPDGPPPVGRRPG